MWKEQAPSGCWAPCCAVAPVRCRLQLPRQFGVCLYSSGSTSPSAPALYAHVHTPTMSFLKINDESAARGQGDSCSRIDPRAA